jgi:FMN phosphatase YigB (HAD superfamily)
MLAARLRLLDIQPGEALVVGDQAEHDIKPARAQGFQAWHFTARPRGAQSGDWPALQEYLVRATTGR